MWKFISENSGAINSVVNALMLIVWAFYFQLLFIAHRRQNRAKLLINRSAGRDLQANCIITNMSSGPLYVEAVKITLEFPEGRTRQCSLTDLDDLTKAPEGDPRKSWFQGPLAASEYLTLGTFENLIDSCSNDSEDNLDELEAFKLTVVATYGPDHQPVAAHRRFWRDTDPEKKRNWCAEANYQERAFWHRRKLRKYLRDSD